MRRSRRRNGSVAVAGVHRDTHVGSVMPAQHHPVGTSIESNRDFLAVRRIETDQNEKFDIVPSLLKHLTE